VADAAGSASVPIGNYSLEVATQTGSFAQFAPDEESENAEELRHALAEEPEESEEPAAAAAAIETFQESADAVTGRIEEADKLLRSAAGGRLLEFDNLTGEIDSLLDLANRLDKAGRFEEELKLMRSLNGLLALGKRWLDLIRSLRSLLRSAEKLNHAGGQAFAHHELGSLHLCAGQSEKASEHLRQALRCQQSLGELSLRCATRHNLDAAQRDSAEAGRLRRSRRLLRSALLAALFVVLGGTVGTGLALAVQDGGHGATSSSATTSSVTLTVHTNFAPDDQKGSATVSLTCAHGATPDESPKTASEASPAAFVVTGFGPDAACTAHEAPTPTGYVVSDRSCRNVAIESGHAPSCTITNRRKGVNSATLIVNIDFVPHDPGASVVVSLACTKGAKPDKSPKSGTEADPAAFKVTGFRKGATCTATETSRPQSYRESQNGCRTIPLTPGGASRCTIVHTHAHVTSAVFSVNEVFSDESTATVNVSLRCDSGAIAESSRPVAGVSPAVFTITGYVAGTTCTATEPNVPTGYTAAESDCRDVALSLGKCTITNTLNATTLTVHIDFSNDDQAIVDVSLSCETGTVAKTPLPASEASPALFTITGFTLGTTCTATEIQTLRYQVNHLDCQAVPLDLRGECTIKYVAPG
jgi:hypothetical protein